MQMPLQAQEDLFLKGIEPHLGEGMIVEQIQYLYVRVVKARNLANKYGYGCDPYVQVHLGNYKCETRFFELEPNPEWNQVFAFSEDRIQSSGLKVIVMDKDIIEDSFYGWVLFDMDMIPNHVLPDCHLEPDWYRLEHPEGDRVEGDLMLAVWVGTQADAAFAEAKHCDAAVEDTGSKVYQSPTLWYLRVHVIEAQDLQLQSSWGSEPETFVRARLGFQYQKTRVSESRSINPVWNEELMFVAEEPFAESLILTVVESVELESGMTEKVLGECHIPLQLVARRMVYHKPVNNRWFNLKKHMHVEVEKKKYKKFVSRIHVKISLEGGYHVLDESTEYSSDRQSTSKQLWKPSIGSLTLGIWNARGLKKMKQRNGWGTTDAYCVAKYGQKWARTKTIVDSLTPKWNEQYTWDVYDPCTVITIGVFHNELYHGQGRRKIAANDLIIGKVRIHLSTLETGCVYTHWYPLLVIDPSGVQKMGEIQLEVRFTCSSLLNMMHMYSQPLLPEMHYRHPLTAHQHDALRHHATEIVSIRLSQAEPPLRKEVVEYILDIGSYSWSMRRSKATISRIIGVLSGLFALRIWFDDICQWKNPLTTILIHMLFIIAVLYPEHILPTTFLYVFLIGIWNYRTRPGYSPHMNRLLSQAEAVNPDELDEEMDSFPTSQPYDILKERYDRLRANAGNILVMVNDLATQGERVQSLVSWRDPRATSLFVIFCLITSIVLHFTPFQLVVILSGCYVMRHPWFHHIFQSVPINFFRRLTSRTDFLL